jgi:SAM-dependent methyltransferase
MTQTSSPLATSSDLAGLKSKQQSAWSSGDYAIIGTTLQIVGEMLCEAADIRPNEAVLDVAAGNGNASLAAARRWAHVTSTDYVPTLLVDGEARAQAEKLEMEFRVADAEQLPFENRQFDAVLSTFGVMFTPDHRRAADEMLRVCKPGGRIAMANWTAGGFIGSLFKVLGKHVPPPPAAKSPALWGSPVYLRELFGNGASSVHWRAQHFNFRYASADHFIDVFRTWYGPVHKAFAALGTNTAPLENDMRELLQSRNCSGDAGLLITGEYLEVVITRA